MMKPLFTTAFPWLSTRPHVTENVLDRKCPLPMRSRYHVNFPGNGTSVLHRNNIIITVNSHTVQMLFTVHLRYLCGSFG